MSLLPQVNISLPRARPVRRVRPVLPRLLLSCTFLSCFFSPARTQPRVPEAVRKQIIKSVNGFKKRNRLVSVSFAFFSGDDNMFEHATGYADVRRKRKATPESIYTLASVTKSITGMTLVDLVLQNYLSLDDSVNQFIEGFPPNVTVLDLLNHTSGFLREKENEHYLTNSTYKKIVDYLPVKFNLKIHRYANINYAAAGAVIEAVTGRQFSDVAEEYYHSITHEKLSFYDQQNADRGPLFVKNYVRKGRRLLPHEIVKFGIWEPAAFAQTTARGLSKFLRYHMTPQFLQFIESHAVTIRERRRGGDKIRECYSLGFRLRYINGDLAYVYHNGFLYGVISSIYYFPQKDAGFAAISNMSTYPNESVGLGGLYRIIEKILDTEFNRELAVYTAEHGYEAGVNYFSERRRQGQAREKMLDRLGRSYLKKGQKESAIRVFRLNSFIFPNSATTHRRLADAFRRNGEDERAEEAIMEGLMAEPNTKRSARILKKMGADND